MKRLKNGLILLFLAILTLLLLSCSERYKEPAPFFDKLHLVRLKNLTQHFGILGGILKEGVRDEKQGVSAVIAT
jgi:hypothetical protein